MQSSLRRPLWLGPSVPGSRSCPFSVSPHSRCYHASPCHVSPTLRWYALSPGPASLPVLRWAVELAFSACRATPSTPLVAERFYRSWFATTAWLYSPTRAHMYLSALCYALPCPRDSVPSSWTLRSGVQRIRPLTLGLPRAWAGVVPCVALVFCVYQSCLRILFFRSTLDGPHEFPRISHGVHLCLSLWGRPTFPSVGLAVCPCLDSPSFALPNAGPVFYGLRPWIGRSRCPVPFVFWCPSPMRVLPLWGLPPRVDVLLLPLPACPGVAP